MVLSLGPFVWVADDPICIASESRIVIFSFGRACRYLIIILTVGWLVVLRLNVPVNNFSVMSGRSHRFLGN